MNDNESKIFNAESTTAKAIRENGKWEIAVSATEENGSIKIHVECEDDAQRCYLVGAPCRRHKFEFSVSASLNFVELRNAVREGFKAAI